MPTKYKKKNGDIKIYKYKYKSIRKKPISYNYQLAKIIKTLPDVLNDQLLKYALNVQKRYETLKTPIIKL